MAKKVYLRCTSGHYFMGEYCPFDGWSSQSSKELSQAAKRLENAGLEPTVQNLNKIGVSDKTIARTLIIEFGSELSTFEAIAPEEIVVNGKPVAVQNLDASLT